MRKDPPPALRQSSALALLCALGGCSLATGSPPDLPFPGGDHRIFDARASRFIDLETLASELADSDYVLFGEYHDDPVAHRLQTALLKRLSVLRAPGTLGLEMFERDVQPLLDDFARGEIGEPDLLARARPWENYPADYSPTVNAAVERGWRLLATNLPRTLASAVVREGLPAIDALPNDRRELAAETIECPRDEYWQRFRAAMHSRNHPHPHGDGVHEMPLERLFLAQCARDETMAETLAEEKRNGPVLHLNGAFHSDYRLGIVPRILRRDPSASVVVLSALPTRDLANPPLAEHVGRADYLIFTRARTGR